MARERINEIHQESFLRLSSKIAESNSGIRFDLQERSLMQRYFIKTYGCQMNVHDSERMAGLLESMGYEQAGDELQANLILINTCSVREKADQKLFTKLGRMGKLKERNQDLVLGVCGCIAQRDAEQIFKRTPFVDLVLGPRAVARLPRMIEDYMETGEQQICTDLPNEFDRHTAFVRKSSVLGYVTVMEGCNKFCSFCIVPYTRGREISKPIDFIIEEVQTLADSGYKEVHLLGQNVNAYFDKDTRVNFAELLRRVSDIEGIERIRFVTSHPNHLSEEIIGVMAERENICKAIHLPPQSGSDKILKLMKRRYTLAEYLDTVDLLKRHMKNISLSGDIIVGFPGETEDDFRQTLDLLEEVEFASLFSFVFSSRPGTKAEQLADDVPPATKLERLHRLQELQSSIQFRHHKEMIGTEQLVLLDGVNPKKEGQLIGRTEGNLVVNVEAPDEYVGHLLKVSITDAGPHSLQGIPAVALTNRNSKP